MKNLRIGLLLLYIKLYDDIWPDIRQRINLFSDIIAERFTEKGLEVVRSKVCRVKDEFKVAIEMFEREDVDAIVTLHLAYSPSLESSETLSGTVLPIIVLDTTPAFDYSPDQDPDELMYNHGIHGVQDMCNLLLRNGKGFLIEAGHFSGSDVLDRVVKDVKATRLAKSMRNAKVGRVGKVFKGMGDFDLPDEYLKATIGIDTIAFDLITDSEILKNVSETEIRNEMDKDKERFDIDGKNSNAHKSSVYAGLVLRKWIDKNSLSAFTVNFLDIDKKSGFPCMPFLEASKSMARGTGYAGEGDVLTAALAGTLMSVYKEVSFTEMFCPDWKNGNIFLSHMGEINIDLIAGKPFLKKTDNLFTDAEAPVIACGRFKKGHMIFVNLSPSKNGTYTFIVSEGQMLDITGEDKMRDSVHGWFRPDRDLPRFLEKYSGSGGTHHSVIVYGEVKDEIVKFGGIMGWNVVEI